MSELTQILHAIDAGDPQAADKLLPLVYAELRQLAAQKLAHEKPGQTLQATALVHEAYIRLVGSVEPSGRRVDESQATSGVRLDARQGFSSRGHFFAAAAEAMRRILVENARRKGRRRHGGGRRRHDVHLLDPAGPQTPDDLIALSEALDRLAAANAPAATLVKLRFFAGLTNEDAAAVLGVSPRKANQIWAYARAWLLECLGHEPG